MSYGAVRALTGVTVDANPGEILVVLGANGAGKTSMLRAISGLVPHRGRVTVDGTTIGSPAAAYGCGVAHLPEGRGLFRRLTVEQNLALAGYTGGRAASDAAVARAVDRLPELDRFRTRRTGTLSGGEQALVALGRLLAHGPRYALLDEPALGLSPAAVDRLLEEIVRLRDDGCGVVLVEQYAARALAVADRVLVLERGIATYAGDPGGVGDPEALVRSYLAGPR